MDFLMDIVKRDETKIKLLMDRWSSECALETFVESLYGFPDGIKMFKDKVLASIKSAEEKDLPIWAYLLNVTLSNIYNMKDKLPIVKDIVNEYDNKQLQIKLLKYSDMNTRYLNVFDLLATREVEGDRGLWRYFLKFIDSSVHRNVLLKCGKQGRSPIFKLFASRRRDYQALLLLEKFEEKTTELLLMKDDEQKTMLQNSSCAIISKWMRHLKDDDLPQFIVDNMDSRNRDCKVMLFNYVQEQVDIRAELLQKLLFHVKRQWDGASFMMIILQLSSGTKGYVDWIWPYITALEAEQIKQLLAQTDSNGDTLLTRGAVSCNRLHDWQALLALYTDDDAKKNATKQMNYVGKNCFGLALRGSGDYFKAFHIWNMKRSNTDGPLFSGVERLRLISGSTSIDGCWKNKLQETIKQTENVDEMLLVTLWKLATSNYDIDFAKVILSKLEGANQEQIESFLTAKTEDGEYSVWHLAAKVTHDRTDMMGLLISLADDAKTNVEDILLNPELSQNQDEVTPLMSAVHLNNYKIADLILSRFSDAKKKQKFLLKTDRITPRIDYKNWFQKEQHEIRRNVLVVALRALTDQQDYLRETSRMPMVKLLVESCDSIKALLNYNNSRMESIYHYLLTQEVCEYFKSMKAMKLEFNVESWSIRDIDGITPFMKALRVSGERSKIECIKWIFKNCCKTSKEKLKLIYQYDNDDVLALEYAGGTVLNFLIRFMKSKCNYKSIEVCSYAI